MLREAIETVAGANENPVVHGEGAGGALFGQAFEMKHKVLNTYPVMKRLERNWSRVLRDLQRLHASRAARLPPSGRSVPTPTLAAHSALR